MTQNLPLVLAALGVLLGCALYWGVTRRGGARAENKKPAKDAPALGESDLLGTQDEIPLLDVPVEAGGYPHHGDDGGDGGGDDDVDVVQPTAPATPNEAVAEPQTAHAFAAESDTAPAIDTAPTAAPRKQPKPGIAPARLHVFGKPPGEFRARTVEGFDRLGQIDYWAKITGAHDVGRETVLALYRDAALELNKPHSIHGQKEPNKTWCNLEDEAEDSRFADLVVSIQLADRFGAISEREMNDFSALVSKLSERTGREFRFMTTVDNALAQAAALAEFAAYFDSVFVLNIRPLGDEPFPGASIDRHAPRLGMERDANHYYSRFKQVGKGKVTLYSLADLSETGRFDFDHLNFFNAHGLVFFTKPAVNRSPGAVFAEMVDTAKAFASRIRGEVSSPHHDDLSQDDVEAIRRSIEQVAAEMERLGIPAGSAQATRLF